MFMIEEDDEIKKSGDENEKTESEPDYSSLNKYFIDDSKVKKEVSVNVKMIVEDVSVTGYSFGGSSLGFGRKEKEIETQISGREIEKEVSSKKDTESRKEFLKELEDDSLTLDTCSSVNRDWGKKWSLGFLIKRFLPVWDFI